MFRFENPYYLYLFLLIPVFVFLHFLAIKRRSKALAEFGDFSIIKQLMPDASFFRPSLKFYLALAAYFFIVLTLARPQFGTKVEKITRKGIEVIIALDVSNSMNCRDIEPSRLEQAKIAVDRLVDQLSNDRVGLIIFAGKAYTQLPVTTDYASAKMFLSTIQSNLVATQGTAIGAAIQLAQKSFSNQENINRAIIVITDGENHEDDAVSAAAEAQKAGIKVYTVGMGSPQGSPIQVEGGSANDFVKDRAGNVVITKLNELMLQQIAAAGNGGYIQANNIRSGLKELVSQLSEMERKEMDGKIYTDYDDKFVYVAIFTLLILIADFIVLERKNKFFKGINLFGKK